MRLFFFIVVILGNKCLAQTLPDISMPDFEQQWHTYLDGKNVEYEIVSSSSDKDGNIYILGNVRGSTSLQHLVTPGAFQATSNVSSNINTPCLVKFSPAGTRLWGTFFGNSINAKGVTCDKDGNVIICGSSNGSNIPQDIPVTPGAHQTQQMPVIINNNTIYYGDGWLAKFSAAGTLLWSTLYGGTGGESIEGIKTDNQNNIYAIGSTTSASGISTLGSHSPVYVPVPGKNTGMLVKFSGDGRRLWGTYYGGYNTFPSEVAIDSSQNIIIGGFTTSHTNISTPGAHLEDYSTGGTNQERLFFAKFLPDGSRAWGTYYGPAVAINNPLQIESTTLSIATTGDDIIFSGWTNLLTGISTPGSFMSQPAGDYDPFVVRLTGEGVRKWGSYFGSTGKDAVFGRCLQFSKDKKAFFIMGNTNSTTGISTNNAYNSQELSGNPYLMKISTEGQKIWGSYISVYHGNILSSGSPGSIPGTMVTNQKGDLFTAIIVPFAGSVPISGTGVFQNLPGGVGAISLTNVLTKFSDTTVIINPLPVVPLSFEVFPNPSNGKFTIRTTSIQPYDYIIYAADGKRIKTGITSGYFTNVNITTAAAGSYIVRATERNTGIIYHRKIIKR